MDHKRLINHLSQYNACSIRCDFNDMRVIIKKMLQRVWQIIIKRLIQVYIMTCMAIWSTRFFLKKLFLLAELLYLTYVTK